MTRRDLLRTASLLPFAAPLVASPRFEPNWASIDARQSPKWYTDAKFGIFIHWGIYSVPAFAAVNQKGETGYAEWYWNSLVQGEKATGPGKRGWATKQFHNRVYGEKFKYEDFAPLFRAELYEPDHWADVFTKAGAKYVALTSKHHEGFTLWKSAEANQTWGRPWNAVDVGPKRDVLLDLMQAGRKRNLHMGIYYSLYEWYNPLWLKDRLKYAVEHMHPQFKDVVRHAEPEIIFSDGEWDLTSAEWRIEELMAWLFNDSPVKDSVVIDDRWGKDTRHKHGGYFTTEYTSGLAASTHPWEESRGMGYSYGYNRMETLKDYHTGRQLTLMLIDIVSRGGNLLLDIGPTGDGQIPVIMEQRLNEIGNWLIPNGEAIYGTTAWKRSKQWSSGNIPKLEEKTFMADYDITNLVDSPKAGYARTDAFFTAKGKAVYAILPRRPLGKIVLQDMAELQGAAVTVLTTGERLSSQVAGGSMTITVSAETAARMPDSELYVLKIEKA